MESILFLIMELSNQRLVSCLGYEFVSLKVVLVMHFLTLENALLIHLCIIF